GLRAVLRGTLAFVAGVVPLLAYNTITQGHPLAFTQGMEFQDVVSNGEPRIAFASLLAQAPLVSGGGFRLRHLPYVLPQNLRYLAAAFGLFLLPAAGALFVGGRRRALVAATLTPYVVGAVVFYSCWGHGDARYLVGAVLLLLVATAIGTSAWCAVLVDRWRSPGVRLAALTLTLLVVIAAPAVFPSEPQRRSLEVAVGAGALAVGAGSLVGPLASMTADVGPFVPALAFAAVGLTRVATGSGGRDPFQATQVDRARR